VRIRSQILSPICHQRKSNSLEPAQRQKSNVLSILSRPVCSSGYFDRHSGGETAKTYIKETLKKDENWRGEEKHVTTDPLTDRALADAARALDGKHRNYCFGIHDCRKVEDCVWARAAEQAFHEVEALFP
jgi:hypothetical protein